MHACRNKKRKIWDRVHALAVQGGKDKEEAEAANAGDASIAAYVHATRTKKRAYTRKGTAL